MNSCKIDFFFFDGLIFYIRGEWLSPPLTADCAITSTKTGWTINGAFFVLYQVLEALKKLLGMYSFSPGCSKCWISLFTPLLLIG